MNETRYVQYKILYRITDVYWVLETNDQTKAKEFIFNSSQLAVTKIHKFNYFHCYAYDYVYVLLHETMKLPLDKLDNKNMWSYKCCVTRHII
jgi:hypothetical protein